MLSDKSQIRKVTFCMVPLTVWKWRKDSTGGSGRIREGRERLPGQRGAAGARLPGPASWLLGCTAVLQGTAMAGTCWKGHEAPMLFLTSAEGYTYPQIKSLIKN